MRARGAFVAMVAMAALAGCGTSPDLRVVSDGSGYGFPDAAPGAFIRLSTVAACVEGGAKATVTDVRFAGSNVPPIDEFAVRTRTADDVGAEMGTDPEPLGGGSAVTKPCPAKGPLSASGTSQALVLLARVPQLSSRIDLDAIEVDYRIDGETHTTTTPINVALCPVGDVEPAADCAADGNEGLD